MSAQPPTPRIACSTVSLVSMPMDVVFPLLASTGFANVEVMISKDPATRDPGRLRSLSEAHGVAIAAVHAPFLMMTRTVWGTDPVGKIDRALDFAERVGAPIVVVHPPYRWQPSYRRWLREKLPEVAARSPVRIAVENMFPLRVRGRSVASFHSVRGLRDLEGFEHVVLDTSHAAVAGLDVFEAVERLGSRLAHVHLSNNSGRGWDSHLPVTRGVLPLARFLDRLGADGFGGTISLEIDLRRHLRDPEALRRALDENRAFCAERLPSPREHGAGTAPD